MGAASKEGLRRNAQRGVAMRWCPKCKKVSLGQNEGPFKQQFRRCKSCGHEVPDNGLERRARMTEYEKWKKEQLAKD